MKFSLLILSFLCSTLVGLTQDITNTGNVKMYTDSLIAFRTNYINTHDVVKTEGDKKLLAFFPIDPSYVIKCQFEKIDKADWFPMNSSGSVKRLHRRYGKLTFTLRDTSLQLYVYQSQGLMQTAEYKDYLFIPFSDQSSGEETYGAGRYLDYTINDIHDGTLLLDFNKAYNPSCAYATGYNCPIPPKENDLPVSIRAGEKNYGKKVH
ncbi:DUF1684 domain-containing protein [Flavitalea flava]